MNEAILLSDHLVEALAHMNRVRELARSANLERNRDAVMHEVTQAELSIARVIGLIAGTPS